MPCIFDILESNFSLKVHVTCILPTRNTVIFSKVLLRKNLMYKRQCYLNVGDDKFVKMIMLFKQLFLTVSFGQ